MAQGFLFSRPITGDEMLALLQRSDATAAGTPWWAGAQPSTQRRRRDSDVGIAAGHRSGKPNLLIA